jgi:MFS family permease
MPVFPVYALLFADAGLSTAEISLLLVLWSAVGIVLEIPSGAWADTVSRRGLLCASALVYAAAFSCWVLFPTFAGFAAGFVLWGLSGALSSGTFQALAYDELAAVGARHRYARVMGLGTTLSLAGMALATLLAAPLVAVGGYALAGWASVGVCLVLLAVAASLPSAPPVISAGEVDEIDEDDVEDLAGHERPAATVRARARASSAWASWWLALRTGLREATTSRLVRGAVLASATLYGLLAFDEYFGLLLDQQGASLVAVPLLLTLVTAGQAVGGAVAERAASWSSRRVGGAVSVAGAAVLLGALADSPWGVVPVAVGYGLLQMAIVVSDVRLQDSIRHGARATVTSASNVLAELLAVATYLGFALFTPDDRVAVPLAVLAAVTVLLGAAVVRWLPAPEPADEAAVR